ncbi:primosomal protein N' [Rhizohabitans arisaemae]|uniref:primosomal protein N' n=1 Tax=Rhizohabitans arisaemae TaxID=2720610 RepID=UPI0024B04201|nr:primosomal protein N' [Rhizohabitans arisaemae]
MSEDEALTLPGVGAKGSARAAPRKATARKGALEPAERAPVARVAVDVQLPHLDRLFDYRVPATMDGTAVPGCRVRVRFAGQLVDGYLIERTDRSEFEGRLAFLDRVVSAEPVLTEEVTALARATADRYAGTLADVLRLAVPPRHAKAEAEPGVEPAARPGAPQAGPWTAYLNGPSFLRAVTAGQAPRAVWTALPGAGAGGPTWPAAVATAVQAALAGGRGALVVVPDGKDVALVSAAMAHLPHEALTAGLGPAERYRRWLRVLRGERRAVVGTRAAVFAPVRDLGLVVLWDDGDDVHAEPHAPYPHAREVLALRAHRIGAAALIGGHTRTAEATAMIGSGWAHPLVAARETIRRNMPSVRPVGADGELARDEAARQARLPTLAWRALRAGLTSGPVLVQVPRRGYLPALACQNCRAPARCRQAPFRPGGAGGPGEEAVCHGVLALRTGHAAPYCRWCGRIAADWSCPACGGRRIRATVVGARRTAEELGRAFPGTPVRTSGRDGILDRVGTDPALIVATPGAEPVPEGGYAAAVLLDGWALLGRPDLRATEEALRRWMNAAALTRPGATVVVLADAAGATVQALVRWDPVTHAERELAERAELGFPPAVRMAALTGSPSAVRELLDGAELPPAAQVLGPVPVGDDGQERALVRVGRGEGTALARALKGAVGVRSARKAPDLVRVRIDPLELI